MLFIQDSEPPLVWLERPLASDCTMEEGSCGPDGRYAFQSLLIQGCVFAHPREKEVVNLINGTEFLFKMFPWHL